MKKAVLLIVALVLVVVVVVVKQKQPSQEVEPIVWYGMAPHPYINEVRQGAEAFEKEMRVSVRKVVGQEWSQDNENVNVEALSTRGHKAFSIFPGDPAGANGLFKQLRSRGQFVIAYGAEPALPTPASFTVATDIRAAAMAAAEELIKMMGGKGKILNVLETVTDVNTKVRDEAINDVVNKYSNVQIVQTISDMTQVSEATNKIQSALAARANEIDGIITTGYNPTIASAAILTEWHKNPKHKKIRYIGIDTGSTVIQAIRDGYIDATIAQNPVGHGYISCALLNLMVEGWTPKKDYQFVDAGFVVITKDNVDTYQDQVHKNTESVLADLKVKYLSAPK